MNTAFIALGSNIGSRKSYLDEAIGLLKEKGAQIKRVSSIYETAPVGYAAQGDFLNLVISIETNLDMLPLLDACQEIESELGRKRTIKNGPRTVDLDILFYNEEQIDSARLIVPHPRLHERAFVLVPLYEIAPNLKMPVTNVPIGEFLGNLTAADLAEVVKWGES